jgi:hypothetical protein
MNTFEPNAEQIKQIELLMKSQLMFHPMVTRVGQVEIASGGISKREWFAGLAMQGLINTGSYNTDIIAAGAVKCADALLKELEKSVEQQKTKKVDGTCMTCNEVLSELECLNVICHACLSKALK